MSLSVTVNRLNRAVTPGSFDLIFTARQIKERNLFCLTDNKLDGTYKLFPRTDVGWWDSYLSDANGYLVVPAVIEITQLTTAYALQINGYQKVFPVDFDIALYKAGSMVCHEYVVGNTEFNRLVTLSTSSEIDRYIVTITRINRPYDVLRMSSVSFSAAISSLCARRERKMHAKLEIVYNNPMYGLGGVASSENSAHSAKPEQMLDGMQPSDARLFRLYDNKLNGSYVVAGSGTQVGWWPEGLPNADCVYTEPKRATITFSARPLLTHNVHGYAPTSDFPVDFNLYAVDTSGVEHKVEVRGNTQLNCPVYIGVDNAVSLSVEILRSSNPNRPAIITEFTVSSSITYYDKDLIDVNILEELTYDDANESLGSISANELVANINNTDGAFYFSNAESLIARQLKKNRRIKAWFGVETPDGVIVWVDMGVFWSYSWDVPVGSLVARVTAFDTIGLLSTLTFENHQVFVGKSIGYMLEYILSDAKTYFEELDWLIDDDLYNIIIPYGWFAHGSYAAALEKLASCDLLYIYCDRAGRVVARIRSESVESVYASWSNSTNIMTTTYPTMYTDLANHIDVTVTAVTETAGEVFNYNTPVYLYAGDSKQLQFSYPMLSMSTIQIDSTAEIEYHVYSWGISIDALTDGVINSIVVNGVYLMLDNSQVVTRRDREAILANGAVHSTVTSDFIQSREHALRIADRLFTDTALTKYDAEITYRGDITLGIGDPVELVDGKAPDNKYFIKRHELYYNGALTGTARLNT